MESVKSLVQPSQSLMDNLYSVLDPELTGRQEQDAELPKPTEAWRFDDCIAG